MTHRRRREQEGGFALLMVFVMAAGIALAIYNQLPRSAFESVRGKEELVVDRAAQYHRAIQLYVAKYQKYPTNLDDLEKTNNVRFLRRRYKNPFTGKDDWRLIHVDNMGKLTDSLVEQKEEKKPNQNNFITEMAGIGQTSLDGDAGGVNVALRKRPSEMSQGEGGAGGTGQPALALPSSGFQTGNAQQPGVPNPIVDPNQQQQQQQQPLLQPGQQPDLKALYPNGVPQYPGQPNPNINPQTGRPYPAGQQPVYPTPGVPPAPQQAQQQTYGIMGPAGQPIGSTTYPGQQQQQTQFGQLQQAQRPNQTYPTQPATGLSSNNTGMGQGTPGNVLNMINDALTRPSPNMPMNLAPGLQILGGLAGIAPKNEGPSIRVVNEQANYKKWEFVYDMRKDNRMKQALGQQQQMMNRPGANGMGGPGMGGPGMGGPGMGGPMGNPTGNSSPFGGQPPQPGGFPGGQIPYGPGSPTSGQQPNFPQPSNPFGGRR
ncbi:MAG: hypothetical protein SGI92_32915 [Bryobacteraceae bacterium]|nr:hypothetical protein [Bryobacteraceae bacterium]